MEEKKETKKEDKKQKKKSNEPQVDLFNTPVYELTEDQIIEKGLKTSNPKDKMCYLGIAICFIFIFIPPIFDKVFDYTRPADTHVEVAYARFNCRRVYSGDNSLVVNIKNEYRESVVQSSLIEYSYKEVEGETSISEIENWTAFENIKGIKITKGKNNDVNSVTVAIDFKNNESLRSDPELDDYTMNFMPQFNYFGGQGFYCTKESKSVTEDSAHPELNKENVWEETEDSK